MSSSKSYSQAILDKTHSGNSTSIRRKRSYAEMEHGGSKLPLFEKQCKSQVLVPNQVSRLKGHGEMRITPHKKTKRDPILHAVTSFLKQKRFATIPELIAELQKLDLFCDLHKIQELGETKQFDLVKVEQFGVPTYIYLRDDDSSSDGEFSSSAESEDDEMFAHGTRHFDMWDFPSFNTEKDLQNRKNNVLFEKRPVYEHDDNAMRE